MLLPLLLALAVQSDTQVFSYLRTARLTAAIDTFDTFESEPGGSPKRGHGAVIIRTVRPSTGGRWELIDTWYDSTGRETARQATRTAARGLMTELETVRATTDSASLLVTEDHATAWVVPQKGTPSLYDGDAAGERYPSIVVVSAIAKTHARNGSSFRYPAYNLYGPSPIATRIDSIQVVRRDTLSRGQMLLPVVVLQRSSGSELWIDEATGVELLSRGNAGPNRWWWHIRRGISAPGRR